MYVNQNEAMLLQPLTARGQGGHGPLSWRAQGHLAGVLVAEVGAALKKRQAQCFSTLAGHCLEHYLS